MQASHWDNIDNPITGEHLRFISRDPTTDTVTVEITFPAGGTPVVEHRHLGFETFHVQQGVLDLSVDKVVRKLAPGEEFTITSQAHFPANTGTEDAVVTVTTSPGAFFERGIRAAFGLARDGDVAPDGRPKDLLALALASERGKYQVVGPPRFVWVAMMTVLGLVAVPAGKRRKLDKYWPPELARPWKT